MRTHLPFEADWMALHNRLSSDDRFITKSTGESKLSGLFRPCIQAAKNGQHRILYVGKATGGTYLPNDPKYPYFNLNGSAFWRFIQDVSGDCQLGGVTWSNVSKIGCRSGNPTKMLVEAQKELAVTTLRQEIMPGKAALVIVFTDGCQEETVYDALAVKKGPGDGFKTVQIPNGKPFYIRQATSSLPSILWIQHPERKTKEVLAVWRKAAAKLLQAM